ncbi:MAG: YceD family protein, partial [Sandaracinaceae bacterium]|nr:YceD family protein [Sandaracinaceae bacterium]
SVSAEMVVDFVQVQGPFFPWSKGVIDLRPEDLDIEFFEGESIPLDGIIREHIVLEIPMKLLCRPDCRGIEIAKDICGLPSDGSSTPQEVEIPPSIETLAQKWRAKHGRGLSGPTKRKH